MGRALWAFFGLFWTTSAFAAPLTSSDLIESIKTHRLDSIETTLEWISRENPEFLEHFTFMQRSLSLQGASPLSPRAIVFGDNASLILTFNGESGQAKYDTLELIQFQIEKGTKPARFELREIRFENGQADVSPVNPPRCLQCHHSHPRPIWSPYETWDGAYGKFDDAFIDFENEKYADRSNVERVSEMTVDLKNYRAFLARKDIHPRYRHLRFPTGAVLPPYAPSMKHFDYRLRPNLKLTGHLAKLQAEAIASRLRLKSEAGNTFDEMMVAQLLACDINTRFPKERIQKIEDGIAASMESRFVGFRAERSPVAHLDRAHESSLLLKASGIDLGEFHMGSGNSWSYFEGSNFMSEFVAQSLYLKMIAPLELPRFVSHGAYGYPISLGGTGEPNVDLRTTACDRLAEVASGKMTSFAELPGPRKSSEPPAVFGMCMSCHDGSTKNGPKLNPRDIKTTERMLERVAYSDPKLGMPPGRILDDREKEALTLHLKSNWHSNPIVK